MKAVAKKTKGELTAQRILDAAETVFASKGFQGSSLREIAASAGIREPGLYNYYAGKRELYAAVLDRALLPMAQAMRSHLSGSDPLRSYTQLPSIMTDLLLEHPAMAALFQQALQGAGEESEGAQLMEAWLDRLFNQAIEIMQALGYERVDRADLAIQTIAMFNLCTGYFLSQRAFESMADGNLTDADNIARQKKLLARIQRAFLLSD
jgi:AcrR family transcriptional regulator